MAIVGSIAEHASALRVDARLGPFANPGTVTLAPTGIAFAERRAHDAYAWSEVVAVAVRRGRVAVTTRAERERTVRTKDGTATRRYVEERTRSVVPVIDGAREPSLVPSFARVLDEMRSARFSFNGATWHEHQNAMDRVRGEFTDQDEPIIAAAAAGLWLAIGVVLALVIPVAYNVAEVRTIPRDAFVLRDHIGPLDPRTLVAAFACSSLVTMLVLRLALGRQASVWARGVARGWKHGSRTGRVVFALLGRALLGTSSAAIFTLLALLSFWPNVAATVFIDETGVRNAVLLPFISLDEGWKGSTVEPAGDGVIVRFSDGRILSTAGRELGGGSASRLLDLARLWSAPPR